jgi:competence protein ComER
MHVGIVGTGAMGAMLVRAHANFSKRRDITVYAANRSAQRLEQLRAAVPDLQTASPIEVAARADVLILCLPAQPYLTVAAERSSHMTPASTFVCISSGVDLGDLAQVVDRPIVKMVPSLAHEAGRGVSLLIRGPKASDRDIDAVRSFMSSMSRPMAIDDEDARIATNLSACGPALVACFADLLAETARPFAKRLTDDQLAEICAETLTGVAALIREKWQFKSITKEVATAGGTTEAAVSVLRQKLPQMLEEMHRATYAREADLRRRARAV